MFDAKCFFYDPDTKETYVVPATDAGLRAAKNAGLLPLDEEDHDSWASWCGGAAS